MVEISFAGDTKRVISEIIDHLNRLEKDVSDLKDRIEELNDLVIVNKLDLVNLVNNMNKVQSTIVYPEPIRPEKPEGKRGIWFRKKKSAKPMEMQAPETEEQMVAPMEAPVQARGNVCPSCGAYLPEHAKFCGKCGAKIGGEGMLGNLDFPEKAYSKPLLETDTAKKRIGRKGSKGVKKAVKTRKKKTKRKRG